MKKYIKTVQTIQKKEAIKEVQVSNNGTIKHPDKPDGPIAAKVKAQLVKDSHPELKKKVQDSQVLKKAILKLEDGLSKRSKKQG